jgi:hypothetical protein
MGRHIIIVVAVAGALLLLGLLAWTRLEIYSEMEEIPYSRAARTNEYLALDRWLAGTGHPVRIVPSGDPDTLEEGPERYACIQASCFDWDGAENTLLPWVEEGGRLVVFVDYLSEEEILDPFLASLGFRAELYEYGQDEESGVPDEDEGSPDEDEGSPDEGGGEYAAPDLDSRIVFYPAAEGTEGEKFGSPETVEDADGNIRIVTVYPGKGSVTVAGQPWFMRNEFIDAPPNARLAWRFTGAALEEGEGFLFIREKNSGRHFFGRLAERGNPLPLALSILALTAIGFWMVIPSFGPPLRDGEPPLRPIRDRFLAEIRFLGKYGSLDSYLRLYVDALKRRDRGGAARLEQVEEALKPGKKLPLKKVILYLRQLEDMAEHLWQRKTGT